MSVIWEKSPADRLSGIGSNFALACITAIFVGLLISIVVIYGH